MNKKKSEKRKSTFNEGEQIKTLKGSQEITMEIRMNEEKKLENRKELRKWYLGELGKLRVKLASATTVKECYEVMRKKTKLSVEFKEKDPELLKEMNHEGIRMWNIIHAKIGEIIGTGSSHMH